MVRIPALLALGALVLSACDGSGPAETMAAAHSSVTAASVTAASSSAIPVDLDVTEPSRHLVLFHGTGVPAGFAGEVERLGGTVALAHASGFGVVEGLTADGAVALGRTRGVSRVDLDADLSERRPDMPLEPEEGTESPTAPQTAFFFSRQWNMRAIDADDAWKAGRLGSPAVTVAVLDTGVDYLHVDLRGRVDLQRSRSFLPIEDDLVRQLFPTRLPITDLGYHGTHVAATISSNAIAAAGVTSQVNIMALKICYGNEYRTTTGALIRGCPSSATFAAIAYAVDNGADVINMSLGGVFSKAGNGEYVGYLNKLFNHARARGVTTVVSAGNEEIDLDHDGNAYKTYCSTPSTICVSATGPTGATTVNGPFTDPNAPASYTNYGRSAINVAAPGGNVVPVYAACSSSSLAVPTCRLSPSYIVGLGGTSMAAPHVSGLAALLVEDYGRNPARIKTRMQQTATDLGQRGTDPFYGKGLINVARALGLSVNA